MSKSGNSHIGKQKFTVVRKQSGVGLGVAKVPRWALRVSRGARVVLGWQSPWVVVNSTPEKGILIPSVTMKNYPFRLELSLEIKAYQSTKF